MHRLESRGDVGLGDLGRVGLQQVRLGGFDVGHRRRQPLPQTQQVVDAVWGKLPVLNHRGGRESENEDG